MMFLKYNESHMMSSRTSEVIRAHGNIPSYMRLLKKLNTPRLRKLCMQLQCHLDTLICGSIPKMYDSEFKEVYGKDIVKVYYDDDDVLNAGSTDKNYILQMLLSEWNLNKEQIIQLYNGHDKHILQRQVQNLLTRYR